MTIALLIAGFALGSLLFCVAALRLGAGCDARDMMMVNEKGIGHE